MVKQRVKKAVLFHETSYISLKMGKAVIIALANLKNHGKRFFSNEPHHESCQRLFINFLVKKIKSNLWIKIIRLKYDAQIFFLPKTLHHT